MSDTPPPARAHRRLLELAALLLICALGLYLRWPALSTEGFHNEDAAGITFNADLLRRGLLPLSTNLEYKAPGTFYLSYWVWSVAGRSIVALQWAAALWALVTGVVVYAGARLLYGVVPALIAGFLYTLASPVTDSIDINYHAWMSLPYVASAVLFLAGLKRGGWAWFLGSGVVLAWGGLIKHQAAALFPLCAGMLAVLPRLRRPEGWAVVGRLRPLLAYCGGLGLGFLPITVYYLARGDLPAFINTFFFSEGGWKYVKGELDWPEKLLRVGDGVLGLWEYMALPTLLVAFTLLGFRRGWPLTRRGVFLAGFTVMSFAGSALGFRFFKSYYLQLLPVFLWIGVHPASVLWRWLYLEAWPAARRPRVVRAALLLACFGVLAPAVGADVLDLREIRRERRVARDGDAQRVARHIKANTTVDDGIWVWGRWAWPVYFHADRTSAIRQYKVLGVLTTNLTNTWRRPTSNTRFTPDSPWQEVIAALHARRPAFIVVAPNEDYSQFTAFKELLRTDYVRDVLPGVRNLMVYRRKDFPLRVPIPAPRPKKVKARPAPASLPGPASTR